MFTDSTNGAVTICLGLTMFPYKFLKRDATKEGTSCRVTFWKTLVHDLLGLQMYIDVVRCRLIRVGLGGINYYLEQSKD